MLSKSLRRTALTVAAAACVGLAAGAPPDDPNAPATAPQPPAEPPPAQTKSTGQSVGETLDRTARSVRQGLRDTAEGVREQFNRARASVQAMGVQARVYSRVHWDKALYGSDIALDVSRDGVATLRGAVPDAAARLQAVALARDTVGVTRVVDELTVRPASPADARPDRAVPASPDRIPAPR